MMEKWLAALRSGEFPQGNDGMFNGSRYCCLGVADVVCFGAKFSGGPLKEDDEGEWAFLSDKRAVLLGLNKQLSEEEVGRTENLVEGLRMDSETRQGALASMNDMGMSFEEIADYIEECGWDN